MKTLFLYGAGKNGEKIKDLIDDQFAGKYSVGAFVDSNKSGVHCNLPIQKLDTLQKEDIIVITPVKYNQIVEIYMMLRQAGFSNVYWCYWNQKKLHLGDFLDDYCVDTKHWGDCVFSHLELHISDKCNLNCKGCTHFSPLFDELGSGFEQIMEDVRTIARLFTGVIRLDILGGEPLLNPDLPKYVTAIRDMLPYATIDVFTNGLLIPRLPEETFRIMREKDIFFSITEYKPTHAMIDKIRECLERNEVEYVIVPYDSRQRFNTPISTNAHSKYPQLCISNGCITVANGRIARCPTLMYVERFNRYFDQNLPTEGILKLKDFESGSLLLQKMTEEVPLCKHCIQHDMEWGICGKEIKLEDFAVED